MDYLKKKGGVFLTRGNVPQLLFSMESVNNIYGMTSNAHFMERTSGGSTGGDAVILALN